MTLVQLHPAWLRHWLHPQNLTSELPEVTLKPKITELLEIKRMSVRRDGAMSLRHSLVLAERLKITNFSLVNSSERHLLCSDCLGMASACWGWQMAFSKGKSPQSGVPMRAAGSSLLQIQSVLGKQSLIKSLPETSQAGRQQPRGALAPMLGNMLGKRLDFWQMSSLLPHFVRPHARF